MTCSENNLNIERLWIAQHQLRDGMISEYIYRLENTLCDKSCHTRPEFITVNMLLHVNADHAMMIQSDHTASHAKPLTPNLSISTYNQKLCCVTNGCENLIATDAQLHLRIH